MKVSLMEIYIFQTMTYLTRKRINVQYRKYVTHLMNLLIRYIALAIKI